MKTMKSFLLVAAIAFSSVLSASTGTEKAETSKSSEAIVITNAVEDLLKNPSFLIEHDLKAKVTLTVNKDNEIVVLSVDCEDEKLESYLKSRLNYNALPIAVAKGQKTFVIPVRITAEI